MEQAKPINFNDLLSKSIFCNGLTIDMFMESEEYSFDSSTAVRKTECDVLLHHHPTVKRRANKMQVKYAIFMNNVHIPMRLKLVWILWNG